MCSSDLVLVNCRHYHIKIVGPRTNRTMNLSIMAESVENGVSQEESNEYPAHPESERSKFSFISFFYILNDN